MKRTAKKMIALAVSSALMTNACRAVVHYADSVIKRDLRPFCERYIVIKEMIAQLETSKVNYVVRYNEKVGREEGRLECDGERVFISLNISGEYSLVARFVHELTHALQYEKGKIGFIQEKGGKWKGINIDVWDEAEAFQMMLAVASGADLHGQPDSPSLTTLYQFKRKLDMEGIEGAVKWLALIYFGLSTEKQNNPCIDSDVVNSTWAKKRGCTLRYMPYQM